MESNLKNRLQEFCQREKLPLPIYTTTRCGGSDHEPQFISHVTVANVECDGVPAENKVKAEMSAASKVFEMISSPPADSIPCPTFLSPRDKERNTERDTERDTDIKNVPLIIIDLDNKGKAMIELSSYVACADIVAFAGKLSPGAREDLIVPIGMKRIIVESAQKDAVDVAIIIYITQQIISGKYKSIYILTGDHFASALGDCIRQWYSEIEYIHVTTSSTIRSLLN